MPLTVSPTESDVFTALGNFLLNVMVAGTEVAQGQGNRVPEPKAENFVIMTMLRMPRLATNKEQLASLGLELKITQSMQCVVQVDIHGPNAFNNANIVSTTFRSPYAVDFFSALAPAITGVTPLFADDPRQIPFVDGEKQYEDRYIVEANLQIKPTVTPVAESARSLTLDVISAETDPTGWPNATIDVSAT